MPYSSTSRLPASVKNTLPKGAQTIYRRAFDNAWEEYKDSAKRRGRASREEAAHKVAWSAVKTKYRKNGEGKWSTRGIGAAKATAAKPSRSTTRPAKAKSTAAGIKQKSARKAPAKAQAKSASVKTKTAARSSNRSQARWQAASASKTGVARGSRAKTATGRRTKTAVTSQQKPRKSRRSVSATAAQRRQQRQESVNMNLPSEGVAVGLPVEAPQSEASQAL